MPRTYKPEVEKVRADSTAPGQTYGERGEQQESFRQVDPAMDAARAMPFEPVGLGAPPSDVERSRFPDTAGAPFGPGPNQADVLPLPAEARQTGNIEAAAKLLPLLERLAAKPTSSAATRSLVRRLRSEVRMARPFGGSDAPAGAEGAGSRPPPMTPPTAQNAPAAAQMPPAGGH